MLRLLDLWREFQILLPLIRDYAVALGVVAAALAFAFFASATRLKLIAVLVACAAVITTIAYSVGLKRGSDRVKQDWDWTLELEHREGEAARTDAQRHVRVEPRDSRVLAGDPWNRDAEPPARGRAQGP